MPIYYVERHFEAYDVVRVDAENEDEALAIVAEGEYLESNVVQSYIEVSSDPDMYHVSTTQP